MTAVGNASARRWAATSPRCEEPLSTTQNTRVAEAVSCAVMPRGKEGRSLGCCTTRPRGDCPLTGGTGRWMASVLNSERLGRAADGEDVPACRGDIGEVAKFRDGGDAEGRLPALPVPAGQQDTIHGPVVARGP